MIPRVLKERGIEMREEEVKIKICGLYRQEDLEYVNEAKPDYVGFIINFPKSHRNTSIDMIQLFIKELSKEIKAVGVFVNAQIEQIVEVAQYLDVIQLHGEEGNYFIQQLRHRLPDKEIWKAFKIRGLKDIEAAIASIADRVVLDNGYGTGKPFDWSLLEHISQMDRPFLLAGGMDVNNIEEAIERFHPFAIDVSSSVETNQCKDREKIEAVVRMIRGEKG